MEPLDPACRTEGHYQFLCCSSAVRICAGTGKLEVVREKKKQCRHSFQGLALTQLLPAGSWSSCSWRRGAWEEVKVVEAQLSAAWLWHGHRKSPPLLTYCWSPRPRVKLQPSCSSPWLVKVTACCSRMLSGIGLQWGQRWEKGGRYCVSFYNCLHWQRNSKEGECSLSCERRALEWVRMGEDTGQGEEFVLFYWGSDCGLGRKVGLGKDDAPLGQRQGRGFG